jgi:hypothetical protein
MSGKQVPWNNARRRNFAARIAGVLTIVAEADAVDLGSQPLGGVPWASARAQ